ncbi:RING-type domain-containing protein [Plasmodiophora brassicae]
MAALRSNSGWCEATTGDAISGNEQCVICHESMRGGAETAYLSCEHQFHTSCILEWLTLAPTCPLCNGLVLTVHDTSRSVQNPDETPPISYPLNNVASLTTHTGIYDSPPRSSSSTRHRSFWCCLRP